jgi:hypothetical protein
MIHNNHLWKLGLINYNKEEKEKRKNRKEKYNSKE